MTELAFDRVEERVADAGRKACHHTFDDAADGIEVVLGLQDFSSIGPAWALSRTGSVSFQRLQGFCCFPGSIKGLVGDAGQAQDMGADGNAVAGQYLRSDGTGKDQGRRQTA